MKILYIKFDSQSVVKNSQELKIAVPANATNGTIHSDTMISLETYTIKQDITKTLNSLIFNASKQEYIDIPNNVGITTPAFSLCLWIYLKTEGGKNSAIFEYFHDDGNGGFHNKLVIKTNESGKLVLAINNKSASMTIINDKWFHLCWTVDEVDQTNHLADWKIYVNGKKDSATILSNQPSLDKTITNNRILLGKGDSNVVGSALNYFNGSLAEITLYDTVIDPILEIYSDDPTIKYLMNGNANSKTEGFETCGGFDYELYKYGDGVPMEEDTMDVGVSNRFIMGRDTRNTPEYYPVILPDINFGDHGLYPFAHAPNNYENLGLGIFFIFMSVVIYKYF